MSNEAPTKTCPYCAEEIKAAAIKCKHCGSTLERNRHRLSNPARVVLIGLVVLLGVHSLVQTASIVNVLATVAFSLVFYGAIIYGVDFFVAWARGNRAAESPAASAPAGPSRSSAEPICPRCGRDDLNRDEAPTSRGYQYTCRSCGQEWFDTYSKPSAAT